MCEHVARCNHEKCHCKREYTMHDDTSTYASTSRQHGCKASVLHECKVKLIRPIGLDSAEGAVIAMLDSFRIMLMGDTPQYVLNEDELSNSGAE